MASSSESKAIDNSDNLCESICKLIQDNDATAEPLVDIVGGEDNASPCDNSNIINDDELEDLVEEQLLLDKIKKIQSVFDRSQTVENGDTLSSENDCIQNPAVDDRNDCDDDSLLDFTTGVNSCDDECKLKEDLDKVSKALTLNILMQSELNGLELFLLKKLKKNQQKQREVKSDIKWRTGTDVKAPGEKSKSCYLKFGMPYFKDEKKFSSGYNLDYRKMKYAGQMLTININHSKMWSLKEKSLLEEGVRNHLVEENIAQLFTKEVSLKQEFQKNENRTREKEIKSEIDQIKMKVEMIKNRSLSNLFSNCSPDREFDWLNISAKHVLNHSADECQRMWHMYVKPSVNKGKWSATEDSKLLELIEKHNKENWDLIAIELGTCRTGYQCFINYQTRLNRNLKTAGKWTPEEDRALASLVSRCRVGNYIPWTKIAYYFESRSLGQLYTRWNSSLNPNLKKGRFSRYEDKTIVNFVRKFGEDFTKISKIIGDRTSTQLRERYIRAIPARNLNMGRWSLDEDKLLLTLVTKHGLSNWSAVSRQFVTRSRTQVRQRYNIIKKFINNNPSCSVEGMSRGPKAMGQVAGPPIAASSESRCLSDLIEAREIEDAHFRKQNGLLLSRIKTGRKKIDRRSELDTKLIHYFREVYTNDALKLKTHYIKPDIEKAVNAMALFCQFLRTHITFSENKPDHSKHLSPTLRNIVKNMRERFTNWGCDCLHPSSQDQFSLCFCHEQNFIDCFPVNLESTLVDESNYLLSLYEQSKFSTRVKKKNCKCTHSKIKHAIPYYLPPNIITAIGFRSVLLIKDKIAKSLSYDRKRDGFFSTDDVEIHCNGLKRFSGYFSDEVNSDNEDMADKSSVNKLSTEESNASANGEKEISSSLTSGFVSKSVPSTSSDCATATYLPSTSARKYGILPEVVRNSQYEEIVASQESFSRLSKQDAVNLWKERLVAILGWPIVLSNHLPNFASKFEDDEKSEKRLNHDRENSSEIIPENSLLMECNLIHKGKPGRKKREVVKVEDNDMKMELEGSASCNQSTELSCELFEDVTWKMDDYTRLNKHTNDENITKDVQMRKVCDKSVKTFEAQCETNLGVDCSPIVQEQSCNETFKQNESSNETLCDGDLAVTKISKCYTRSKIQNRTK